MSTDERRKSRRVSVGEAGEGLIKVANAMKHHRSAIAGTITQILNPHRRCAPQPTTDDAKILVTAIAALRETNLFDAELFDAAMAVMKEHRMLKFRD